MYLLSLLRRRSFLAILSVAACTFVLVFHLLTDSHMRLLTESSSTWAEALNGSQAGVKLSGGMRDKLNQQINYQLVASASTTGGSQSVTDHVLVLTPMLKFNARYWENLLRLTYPRNQISLGFIVPRGVTGNTVVSKLYAALKTVQSGPKDQRFARVTVLRQDTETSRQTETFFRKSTTSGRASDNQACIAIAKLRNSILFTTLRPETAWVLWVNGNIVNTPSTLIQDLISHNKPIVVANRRESFYNSENEEIDSRSNDFRSWSETSIGKAIMKNLGADEIVSEKSSSIAPYRKFMAFMTEFNDNERKPGKNVTQSEIVLDGVGTGVVLVKADVHRDGAMFPAFPVNHLLESEGFAQIAARLGWKSYGLPAYFVYTA